MTTSSPPAPDNQPIETLLHSTRAVTEAMQQAGVDEIIIDGTDDAYGNLIHIEDAALLIADDIIGQFHAGYENDAGGGGTIVISARHAGRGRPRCRHDPACAPASPTQESNRQILRSSSSPLPSYALC